MKRYIMHRKTKFVARRLILYSSFGREGSDVFIPTNVTTVYIYFFGNLKIYAMI